MGLDWNSEIYEELGAADYSDVRVFSRDWTVGTILDQINQGNIDLNPQFQRRNAWDDTKRSRLIESAILGVPIPQIILAEPRDQRGSFLVIDGKQRLLALKGFADPAFPAWSNPKLKELRSIPELNGLTYEQLSFISPDRLRMLINCDIRCTIISGYTSNDVLYDIFFRLNTGGVSLSTQELRQAWYRGDFSDRLIAATNRKTPLHLVLNGQVPDPRLRDAELLLRLLAIESFPSEYRGSLKDFLDRAMYLFNLNWASSSADIVDLIDHCMKGVDRLASVMTPKQAGRKFTSGRYESRFNRAIFEAQSYYFSKLDDDDITPSSIQAFRRGYEELCEVDIEFRAAVESTTKTVWSYFVRYHAIRDLVNEAFNKNIQEIPIR